ncbi:LIGHT-DEPENDENT SHORT HYPOCOTYLS 6 [Paramuricea clavata]|uniref:LIGHT-DEPENDENT SHORT HYPOCOTYLS 6 n=1 Tax=Paramuricea clavata TaxID=317549 RepID=A0A7D9DXH0_PARCT|nr:LIGHT-DEPENDENT SHORT HYPOCOTYLS 6 [Paramuricea clavata]
MANVLLIYQHVGKSIRETAVHPIPLHPSKNPSICPVENLKFYHTLCKAMQLDLASGFLFHTTANHTSISSSPFLASAAQAMFVTYLKFLGLYEMVHGFRGNIFPIYFWTYETVHGFRGGTAILLSLLGASKNIITKHIRWSSTRMVGHYTQADKVLTVRNTVDRLNESILPVA